MRRRRTLFQRTQSPGAAHATSRLFMNGASICSGIPGGTTWLAAFLKWPRRAFVFPLWLSRSHERRHRLLSGHHRPSSSAFTTPTRSVIFLVAFRWRSRCFAARLISRFWAASASAELSCLMEWGCGMPVTVPVFISLPCASRCLCAAAALSARFLAALRWRLGRAAALFASFFCAASISSPVSCLMGCSCWMPELMPVCVSFFSASSAERPPPSTDLRCGNSWRLWLVAPFEIRYNWGPRICVRALANGRIPPFDSAGFAIRWLCP